MEQPDFQSLVLELAEARRNEEILKNKWADPLSQVKTATYTANKLEEKLRESCEQWFIETGEQLPHEGIKVVVEERLEIDPEINRLLAFDEDPSLLILDMKALKQIMKEGKAPWVKTRIVKKAVPHIRSELFNFINVEKPSESQKELFMA